ncbi:hypothetical protein [Flavobacterium ardleyense]|uniref:hypothetical protein n=1 Tax=Flavobacterium ardleyense TaxID=2038737 RepID=UPI00298CD2B0|nr:hypothetical protein [Flavobacterium ardleyense]
MMSKFLNFLKYFIPFVAILFSLQYFITAQLAAKTPLFYPLWTIYLFHVVSVIVVFSALLAVHNLYKEYTGYAFMGATLMQMLAAVVFLIPLIKAKLAEPVPDIAAFFIPYFLFLFFETIFAIKIINSK